MAEEQKKKRSRFGEEFHELFPQLILPTALGLISSYSPMAAAGVRTGLGAADVFSDIRQRKYENEQAELARQGLEQHLAKTRAAKLAARDQFVKDQTADLVTQKDFDNLFATVEETRKTPFGKTVAASEVDPSTALNQDVPGYFNDFFPVKFMTAAGEEAPQQPAIPGLSAEFINSIGASKSSPATGLQATDALGLQGSMGPSINQWLEGPRPTAADIDPSKINTSRIDQDIEMQDLAAATLLANPTVGAQMIGNWEYQERGFQNELERMRQMADMYATSDAERQKWEKYIKEYEFGRREAIIKLQDEIDRRRPVPSQGGAYRYREGKTPDTGEYIFEPGPQRAGAGAYYNLDFSAMSDANLDKLVGKVMNDYANAYGEGLSTGDLGSLESIKFRALPMITEMMKRPATRQSAIMMARSFGVAQYIPGAEENPNPNPNPNPSPQNPTTGAARPAKSLIDVDVLSLPDTVILRKYNENQLSQVDIDRAVAAGKLKLPPPSEGK